jgi:hypothetical protein
MKLDFSVRDWVNVAVFGALWGALEMTLGAYLHVIFPSLANTFFTGLIMAGIGAVIVLVGRTFVPKTGAVLFIGIITAILKVFSLGGMVIGAVVAILAEVILIELALLTKSSPPRWRYILAGALAVSWNFFHKFVMMRIIYGKDITQVYTKMVQDGAAMLNMEISQAIGIIIVLLLFRVAVGAVAGWLGWDLGYRVSRRLDRT